MKRLLQRIRDYMPLRRRRRWRYVSGRRRRRGVALMALIILAVFGWWHFTNDARIKAKAVAYLERLTGARVRIQDASFTVFEGIKLRGVRVFYEIGGHVEDIVHAREVRLDHEPLSLLRAGRLAVTGIICVDATLTVTQDVDRDEWNCRRLLKGLSKPSAEGGRLPTIRIRDSFVIRKEIYGGAVIPLGVEPLDASAVPVAGTRQYQIRAEIAKATASATLDLDPVAFTWTGSVPAGLLRHSLPHGYRQWWEAWQVGGVFGFEGSGGGSAGDRLVLTLTDASMALPLADGDVRLSDLNGRIEMTRERVEVVDVTGKLPQLAGASVRVTGSFDGFTRACPMNVRVDVDDLRFPLTLDDSPFGRVLAVIQRKFRPSGPVAMAVDIVRPQAAEGDGGDPPKLRYQVTASPQSMMITVGYFPMPLTDVRGKIEFDSKQITLTELTGRSGDGRVKVNGTARIDTETLRIGPFDVNIETRRVPLGDPFRAAADASDVRVIRETVRRCHDRFDPTGACDIDVHLFTNAEGRIRAEVDLAFGGDASVIFDRFPYRLTGVSGKVIARRDGVKLVALRAGRGKTRVRLDGALSGWAEERGFAINVKAWDVALDEHLGAALATLAPRAAEQYAAFALAGAADIDGTVAQAAAEPVRHDLTVTLKNASARYEKFPYPLEGIFGELHLSCEAVAITRLDGRHGDGRVHVEGKVDLTDPKATPPILIEGRQIEFDDDLRRSVAAAGAVADPPFDADALWDQLQPSGRADLRIDLRPPAILARPGLIELRDLVGGAPSSPIKLSGRIHIDEDHRVRSAVLALDAVSLPIDATLFKAMPARMQTVTSLLGPGGRCDIQVPRLEYRAISEPAVAADGSATTQPTTRPADIPDDQWRWVIAGAVRLYDASFQKGAPATSMNGSLDGAVYVDDGRGGLKVDVALAAESLLLWNRRAERLRGTIAKAADDPELKLSRLWTRFCGGQLGGDVTIELGEPTRYSVRLDLLEARLAHLLNADPAAAVTAMDKNKPTGRIDGRLELSETAGEPAERKGLGEFRIANARIGRIPILLGLANVALLQLPTTSAFSTGHMKYRIEGEDLICEEIYLEGANRSVLGFEGEPTTVLGTGTIDMRTENLKLVFRTGPPALLRGVAAELWTLAADTLVTTYVFGPWRNPVVETVPFPRLKPLLEEIVGTK